MVNLFIFNYKEGQGWMGRKKSNYANMCYWHKDKNQWKLMVIQPHTSPTSPSIGASSL